MGSALRLDSASSQYLYKTAGLVDHNANYTVAGWFYFESLASGFHTIFNLQSSGHDWGNMDIVLTDGTTLKVNSYISYSGSGGSGSTLSTGQWYHIALVRASFTSLQVYLNSTIDIDLSHDSVESRADSAYQHVGAHYDSGPLDYGDLRVHGLVQVQRALSTSELSRLMRSTVPANLASVKSLHDFLGGRLTDLFGTSSFTAVNSPVTAEGPPIQYRAGEPIVTLAVAAASGGTTVGMVVGKGKVGKAVVGGTPESAAPNTNGTVSQVASASAAASGNVAIGGTSNQTGAATASASGTVATSGTASGSAGATSTGAGSVGITGATISSGGASLVAQATVGTPGSASTLGSSSSSAAATVAIDGSSGASTGASLTASGTVANAGTLSQILSSAASFAAAVAISGSASHEARLTSVLIGGQDTTATNVTVHTSIYTIGVTQVYFDGSECTSSVGQFWSHGWLEVHVYYPGSVVPDESYCGAKRFGILVPYTRSGTIVRYRAADRAGVFGEWQETTITVADISTAHYKQYVDADNGSDTNDGLTTSTPVQTQAQACTNIKAHWTLNGTHVIYVLRDTAARPFGNPIWQDGHTVRGRIIYTSYGAGSSRAAIDNTNFEVNCGPGQTSMVFWGVHLDFQGGGGISLDANIGGTRTVPYDFIALDCTIKDTGSNSIAAGLTTNNSTGRNAHTYSRIAIENCTIFGANVLFAIFGFDYASIVHIVGNNVGPLWTSNTSHPIRIWNVSDVYMRVGDYDAEAPDGNDIRFVAEEGDGEDSAIRRVTLHNVKVSGEIYSHGNVSATDTYYVRDVEVIGGTRMFRPTHNTSGGESFDVDQILHRNVSHPDYYELALGSNGTIGRMVWDHCTFIKNFHSGPHITLGGADTRYTAGGLTFDSCLFYWDLSGNWFEQDIIQASSMTNSQLAALIAYSNNNVGASVDTDPVYFRDGSVTLATWQGATVHDDNSAVASSTTLPITTLPSSGWDWNPRLSSTGGYLAGKGLDPTYLLDVDGHIRVGNYPGVHDPEASAFPEAPSLGPTGSFSGQGSASATAAGTVGIGGGLTGTPAASSAASGAVGIAGSLGASATSTAVADGRVGIAGTGSSQFGASATSVGGVSLTGTGTGLTGASLTAAGVVSEPGAILGTASGHGGASLTAVGLVSISGGISATTGLASASTGAVGITGGAAGVAGSGLAAYGETLGEMLGGLVGLCSATLVAFGTVSDPPSPGPNAPTGGIVVVPNRRSQRFPVRMPRGGDRGQWHGARPWRG